MKRVIGEDDIVRAVAAGRTRLAVPPAHAIVTPAAWSRARELGLVLDQSGKVDDAPDAGHAERRVDPSGVLHVRGDSVRLGTLAAVAPAKQVGILDLVSSAHGSPMSAGIMRFARDDGFAWHLGYDEIDLVLEGILALEIEGRTIEARTGDVLFIPKGSSVVFGTPSQVRVFYVTHPADWAG